MSSVYFGENKSEPGHGKRFFQGAVVATIARGINGLIQIGSVLFLARLLTPQDYGVVSMVAALTGFAPLFVDLGTRDAVTQRKNISEGEVSALFWITVGVGCSMAVLVMACGPLIAKFYGEPNLAAITAVSGLTFVVTALNCQHSALLRRAMKFRELAIIDVTANAASAAIAIAMAFAGYHFWALALRPITANLFEAIAVWLRCGWLPGRPTFTPGVKDMLRFGLYGSGLTMTAFVTGSADRVALGYRSGPVVLGYYQNAIFVYESVLSVFGGALHAVAVTSLSKVSGDHRELRRLWSKAISTLAFFCMPAFGILAVVGQDLVVLLLGAKWDHAGALLSILALRGIPQSVDRSAGWLHVAAGRTERWLRWGIATGTIQILALLIGLQFGAYGIVVAHVVCMYALLVPNFLYAGRPVGIGLSQVLRAFGPQLVGALIAVAIAFSLRFTVFADTAGVFRIFILSFAYGVIYLLVVAGIFQIRTPIRLTLTLLHDMRMGMTRPQLPPGSR